MKILFVIIYIAFLSTCPVSSEGEKSFEQLQEQNTEELAETKELLRHIGVTNENIKKSLDQHRGWLDAINNVDGELSKVQVFLSAQGVAVQETLNNITLRSGRNSELVLKDLGSLSRLQLSTKQQIARLEEKLDGYQKQVLQSALNLDNNILYLTKLITRAVLPELNGLQSSFNSLETSQINIEVELKSLARIKEVSNESNLKLNLLGGQLVSLNRTQDARFAVLSQVLSQLKPTNTWQIENALRELIISQKRIELDLEACEQRPASHHSVPFESYQIDTSVAAPSLPQTSKQADWVQIWTHGERNKQGPGSHSASPYGHVASSYVSRQQPLPWDAPVPVSAQRPKQVSHQTGSRRRPATKPCVDQSPSPSPMAPIAPPVESPAQSSEQSEESSVVKRFSLWNGSGSPLRGY